MEDDELHWSPLQHALLHKAPFYVISTFVSHWLLLEDLQSLTEMQLVHLACVHNAPFDVIRYLSSLFPESLTMRNDKGYTPFMLALEDQLNDNIINLLSYSNFDAIGDFDHSEGYAKNAIIDEHFGHSWNIDSDMTMFRLQHKDPSLNSLVIGDSFHCMLTTESDGSFDSSYYERTVMDVLDTVPSLPHLEELILAVDDVDSILWTEGNARNALISVLRDLPSTICITIRSGMRSLVPVAEIINHCQHLKFFTIYNDGYGQTGRGMGAVMKSLSNLPVLESVQFIKVNLIQRGYPSLLYIRLMKKKSLKSILMVGTKMSRNVASSMNSVFKDCDECNHLEFISLFDCGGHHLSKRGFARVRWQPEHWQEDIDLQLAETAHVKHTRTSVSDFITNIQSRDTSSTGRNEDLQFITDIRDVNEKDSEQKYDPICRPDHLYALIQSKPDYIKRCVDLERECIVSNKRQKII
jgi:hypothetical protein